MIEIVEGRGVGAGKSFYTCTRIIEHLKDGGTVCASDTFGLYWDKTASFIARRYKVEVLPDQFRVFQEDDVCRMPEITPMGSEDCPVLVVVDEAHTKLSQDYSSDKDTKRKFFNWLTQSRHDDVDVIFISQAAKNMDCRIVRLCTFIWRLRNMTNFRMPFWGGWKESKFALAQYDSDGSFLMNKSYLDKDPEIFACYRSKSMRGKHRASSDQVSKRKLNTVTAPALKRSPMFKVLLFTVPLLLLWGAVTAYGIIKGDSKEPPKAALAAKAVPGPGSIPVVPALPADAPSIVREEIRHLWRIQGKIGLETLASSYRLGELSPHGLVEDIRVPDFSTLYGVVRCNNAGCVTYVICDRGGSGTVPVSFSAPLPPPRAPALSSPVSVPSLAALAR